MLESNSLQFNNYVVLKSSTRRVFEAKVGQQ